MNQMTRELIIKQKALHQIDDIDYMCQENKN